MNRLLLALPLALFASGALAQSMTPETYRDLWCATAYQQTINIATVPPGDQARAQIFLEAADKLMERGVSVLTAVGWTADAINKKKTDMAIKVVMQVSPEPAEPPDYRPEECDAALVPLLPPDFLAEQAAAQ